MSTMDSWDWALNEFVHRTPRVAHAIVVSADGLPVARSDRLPPDRAGQLASVVAGLVSLLQGGAARCFDAGDVRQCVVEMAAGYLLIAVIPDGGRPDGSSLGVLAAVSADLGVVGFEMAKQVGRFGRQFTPEPRRSSSGVRAPRRGRSPTRSCAP